MTEHPITILRREKALAEQATRFWRRTAGACLAISALCMVLTGATVYLGREMAQELLTYKDNCIRPTTAKQLIVVTEQVSRINQMCLESHRRHIDVLEKALPGVFVPDDRLTKWGMLDQNGGKNDQPQALSAVPTNQAIGGVLPGERP